MTAYRCKQPLRAAAALAACLVLLPGYAGAGETLDLLTGPDYPPFTSQKLAQGGLAVAVMEAALATQGYDMTVTVRPWQRGFARTVNGDADGTFPYLRTAERAQKVRFSDPLFHMVPKVLSKDDAPVRFDGTQASLTDKRICLPQGYEPDPFIAGMIEADRLRLIEPGRVASCPNVVQHGRADFWVENNFVWPWIVADSPYDLADFHVAETGLPRISLHFIVGKAHPKADAILAAVNDGLAAIRNDGTFDRLVQRYRPPPAQ